MIASTRFTGVKLNHLQDGDISYYVTFKLGNKNVFRKVGKKSEGINEIKAKNLRSELISQMRHGKDISQKSQNRLVFDDLAEIYFSSNKAHNLSNHKLELMYKKHVQPSFGDVVFSSLDDQLIYELQALKLADGLSEGTANAIVKLINRIVGFCIKRGVITYSPFKNIKLFKVDNTRLRYLSKDEISKLLEKVQDDLLLELFVRVALATGARARSVLHIKKSDVDLENRMINLYDFKRKRYYTGYADTATVVLLREFMQHRSENSHVVSLDGKELKYHALYTRLSVVLDELFNSELEKKDRIHRVVIHTLRHTFASHLALKGVPLQEIQKLMHHKDINQTLKYAKLMPNSGKNHIETLYKD